MKTQLVVPLPFALLVFKWLLRQGFFFQTEIRDRDKARFEIPHVPADTLRLLLEHSFETDTSHFQIE